METRNNQYQANQAALQYVNDLKSLIESNYVQSQHHLGGDAYSIVYNDQINFYLLNINQVVSVRFDSNIQISQASHVFLFEARFSAQTLGSHFALVFGNTNFALVLIDPNNHQQGYKVQWIKEYQSLEAVNAVSFVSLMDENLTQTRQGIPEHTLSFILGAHNYQKVFELRVSIRLDSTYGGLQSVMTNQDERIVYQEAKTLTSRISSFITNKLNRGAAPMQDLDADTSKTVRNVQVVGSFVVIITNRDIIIVKYANLVKVYESEYLGTLKNGVIQSENDLNQNLQLMRNITQFGYIASHSCAVRETNQICINLFLKRDQAIQNPQSYQIINESHIIQHSRFLTVSSEHDDLTDRDDSQNSLTIHATDKVIVKPVILKAFAFSYEYFTEESGLDVASLLFVELFGGQTTVFEFSLFKQVQNTKVLPTKRVNGLKIQSVIDETQREQLIRVAIMSEDDVSSYEYDPLVARFTQVEPERLREGLNEAEISVISQQQQHYQQQPIDITVIVSQDSVKQYIFRLLDQVANFKYATKSTNETARMQQQNHVKQQVQMVLPQVTREGFLTEVRHILDEQIDLQIDDNHFYNKGVDEIKLTFSDDGLICRSLDNKLKKLEVIQAFLEITELYNPSVNADITQVFNRLKFNLNAAFYFRDQLDKVKLRNNNASTKASMGMKPTDYTLEMRIISKAIYVTAEKLGFTRSRLQEMGVTATNVVFSNVSQVSLLFESLIGLALDANVQANIAMSPQEDIYLVQEKVGEIMIDLLGLFIDSNLQTPLTDSFIVEQTLLSMAFQLCDKMKAGCNQQRYNLQQVLNNLSSNILDAAVFSGIHDTDSELFNSWKNNLVEFVESGLGQPQALEFAKKYQSRELLCRLVFDLGSDYFDVIHQCVSDWGQEFLDQSIDQFYGLERGLIEKRRQEQVTTLYRGLILFDLFEKRYFQQIAGFLETRNKKLFALLMLRNQQSNIANDLMRREVIPNIEGVQTMKVFSSVALINLQHGQVEIPQEVYEGNEAFYKTQLQQSTLQAVALPESQNLEAVTPRSLELILTKLNEQNSQNIKNNLREVLTLAKNTSVHGLRQASDLKALKLTAWELVVQHDRSQLVKLKEHLENSYSYLGQQITDALEKSYLYSLASEFAGTEVSLDPEIIQQLLSTHSNHRDALSHISQYLSFANQVQFSQRPSLQDPHQQMMNAYQSQ